MPDSHSKQSLIIRIGKKQFIAGMQWQYLPLRGKRHLRLRAKAENITHWVSCNNNHNAIKGSFLGTCHLQAAEKSLRHSRYFSLALLVIPHLALNSYAVFPLTEKRFWFIARYEGEISPFSDVVGDAEEIARYIGVFLQLLPDGHPWVVYAPEGFVSCQALLPPDYQQLLTSKATEWRKIRLTSCDNKAALRGYGVLLLFFAAAVGGHTFWQKYQEQKNIAAAQRYLREQQALQAISIAKAKPWDNTPSFRDVIKECQQQWRQLPLLISGWQFSDARCESKGKMKVHYLLKQPGNIGSFSHRVDEIFRTAVNITFNIPGAANDATFFLPLEWRESASASQTESRDVSVRDLVTYAQKMNLGLRLAPEEASNRVEQNHQVWQLHHFSLVSAFPPLTLFADPLFTQENIRAKSVVIENNDRKLNYRLDGVLYVAH